MIIQPAKVIAETELTYVLETLPKSACPRCAEGKGCGGGILAQAFANKTYQLSISKNKHLELQQFVQIGINSSLLVRASLLLYLLPLVFMLTATLIAGSLTMQQDIYTVPAAILGIVLGILVAKRLSNHYIKGTMSTPVLIDDEKSNCWYPAD